MLSWLKGDKVDHPLADAKRAKSIIDGFPYRDPWKTLEDASYWLGSVNETDAYKIERRFELIVMLDMAARKAQERMLDTYVVLPESERIQEKRIWKTVTDFCKLLGDGYLICVDQAREINSVPNAFKPQLPVVAARTLRALRQQLKWVLMRYGVVPSGLWEEFARCAVLAEAVGAMEKPLELHSGPSGSSEQSSPCYEFLRAMMLWMASPSGLSPAEQDIAERLVVRFTAKFCYAIKPWDGCNYCFDLAEARPPVRLMRSTPVSAATRYFDVNEARQAVQALFAVVNSTGNIPSGIELGPAADGPMAARVLKHLGFNWAKEMPERGSERRRTAMSLRVVHGYQNVQGAIEPGSGEGLNFSDTLSHDSWVAEDASAGGYGVIVPAGKGEWLRVGILVALRSETDLSWHLGVIRRVTGNEHRQHRVAIQLIAKLPVPVYLRSLPGVEQGSKRQNAILLSARTSPSGSLHIVARRDLFDGREPIEAMFGKPPSTVILDPGGVVESGHDFDWLRYKLAPLA